MPAHCALKSCQRSAAIASDEDRVETKVCLPKKLQEDPTLCVSWSPDGNAVFHRACWEHLLSDNDADNEDDQPRRKRRRKGGREAEAALIREAVEVAELHDSAVRVAAAAEEVAALLRKAKHCVFFTGAGLSTAAGIGDYRGKDGKWTEMDREAHREGEFCERLGLKLKINK